MGPPEDAYVPNEGNAEVPRRSPKLLWAQSENADAPDIGNVRDIVAENSSLNGNRRCDGMSPEHVALNF